VFWRHFCETLSLPSLLYLKRVAIEVEYLQIHHKSLSHQEPLLTYLKTTQALQLRRELTQYGNLSPTGVSVGPYPETLYSVNGSILFEKTLEFPSYLPATFYEYLLLDMGRP
jgi:hypothetical protein